MTHFLVTIIVLTLLVMLLLAPFLFTYVVGAVIISLTNNGVIDSHYFELNIFRTVLYPLLTIIILISILTIFSVLNVFYNKIIGMMK